MFGRNAPPNQPAPPTPAPAPAQPPPVQAPVAGGNSARPGTAGVGSVVGTDLAIVGQKIKVISQSLVRIDGHIEGDVDGREVIVGENGIVNGTVTANSVEIFGTVHGAINASSVMLQTTARVDGDVNHKTLMISEGAQFDGRVRRASDESSLEPNLDVAALSQAAKG